MAIAGQFQLQRVHRRESWWPMPLGLAIALALALVLLSVIRWEVPTRPVPEAVMTLQLQPPAPLPVPVELTDAPQAARAQVASVDASAPAPMVPSAVPLPVLEAVQPGSSGSGGGIGGRVDTLILPEVQMGALQIPARRIVFVADVSASMGGTLRGDDTLGDVAAQALCRALAGLPDTVQFRLMLFGGALSEPLGSAWKWPNRAQQACAALQAAMRAPSGLTRSNAIFDEGGLHEVGADAVVLVTDGGILDLEAGMLERWLELSPGVRFDVVLIGPVGTPDEAQRRLTRMARRTGGGVHRLFGTAGP